MKSLNSVITAAFKVSSTIRPKLHNCVRILIHSSIRSLEVLIITFAFDIKSGRLPTRTKRARPRDGETPYGCCLQKPLKELQKPLKEIPKPLKELPKPLKELLRNADARASSLGIFISV